VIAMLQVKPPCTPQRMIHTPPIHNHTPP
jgi:hypothetical protein